MILAIINNPDNSKGVFFETWEECYNKTFSPKLNINCLIDTSTGPKGKTYQDKKDFLREAAIGYSGITDYIIYDFFAEQEVKNYFAKYGRKYGLVKEFRENAIC